MTIETKYNIGETRFWVGYDGTWHYGEILGIFITNDDVKYAIKEHEDCDRIFAIYVSESDLFPTKEELLKSL